MAVQFPRQKFGASEKGVVGTPPSRTLGSNSTGLLGSWGDWGGHVLANVLVRGLNLIMVRGQYPLHP